MSQTCHERSFDQKLSGAPADHLLVANVLATSRAHPMKSFVTGLSVRFFSVTMPTAPAAIGRSIGNILSARRLPLKRTVDADRTVKNRPVAISAL